MTPAGFPHSDIPGSKPVCGSPRLIAAYHVLHRLLVPRHPPCALSNLTGLSFGACLHYLPVLTYSIVKDQAQPRLSCRGPSRGVVGKNWWESVRVPAGAEARGTVTELTLFVWLVEIAGIEPATSGLQSRRSPN